MSQKGYKRQKMNYYDIKKSRHAGLQPGMAGFLCFCNFREKDCIKEALNLIREYLDPIKSPDSTQIKPEAEDTSVNPPEGSKDDSDEDDIEDALAKEIETTKKECIQRTQFKVIESGAKNIIFIRSSIENHVDLTLKIMKDISETKEQKTRFLLRLVPIQNTCKANISDIKECINKLVDVHFNGEPKSFSVIYNHRNNSNLKRDDLIKEIATVVVNKNEKNSVNLKNPDLAIIVEIIRNICLLSILPDYVKYKKYNLHQLCGNKDEQKTEAVEKVEDDVEKK